MKCRGILLGLLMCCLLAGCSGKETYFAKAEKSFEAGSYAEALELYNKAITEEEKLQLSYRGAGICSFLLQDYVAAEEFFAKSLNESNGRFNHAELDVAYYQAENKVCLGKREEAVDIYTNIIGFDDKESDAYLYRGLLYTQLSNVDAALKDFEKAVEFQPKQVPYYYRIYQALAGVQSEEAQKFLDKGLKCESKTAEEVYMKGALYMAAGETESAVENLNSAKEKGYARASYLLGDIYWLQGDSASALSCYEEYTKGANPTVQELIQIMECRVAVGDVQKALDDCGKAIEKAGAEDVQALLFEQIVLNEKVGDFGNARVLMEQYLEKYPNDTDAQHEYEFLKTR